MSKDEVLPGGDARREVSRPSRRWSVAQKRRIVLESMGPGSSAAKAARRHGVNANQVHSWRKLYREGGLEAGGGFVPVRVVGEAPVTPGAGRMTVVLCCGLRVVVDATVDASALGRVLGVLKDWRQ